MAKPAWAAQGVPRPSVETPTRPTPCLVNASAAGPVKPAKAAWTDGARRRQPENGVGAGKCLVHHRRVAVRALDNVKVLADPGRELRRVAGDDPELFAAIEQVAEHLAADLAGGGGDDDHGNLQC